MNPTERKSTATMTTRMVTGMGMANPNHRVIMLWLASDQGITQEALKKNMPKHHNPRIHLRMGTPFLHPRIIHRTLSFMMTMQTHYIILLQMYHMMTKPTVLLHRGRLKMKRAWAVYKKSSPGPDSHHYTCNTYIYVTQ